MSISSIGAGQTPQYTPKGETKKAGDTPPEIKQESTVKEAKSPEIPKAEETAPQDKVDKSATGDAKPARDPKSSKAFMGSQSKLSSKITGEALEKSGKAAGEGKSPEYISSPGLDHNTQTCNPDLASTPLYKNGKWNGPEAMRSLHQVDADPNTKSDESRCGASAVLGGMMMKGPEAVQKTCENLFTNGKNLNDEEKRKLNEIRNRVADGSATTGDMQQLQDMMYRSAGGKDGKPLTNEQLVDLQKQVGAVDPSKVENVAGERKDANGDGTTVKTDYRTFADPKRGQNMINDMKPGESRVMNIDTDKDGDPNHYVTVGKDKDGKLYVYDPYPKANQPAVVYQGNPAFDTYVNGDMGADLGEANRRNYGFKKSKVDLFVGGVMDQ